MKKLKNLTKTALRITTAEGDVLIPSEGNAFVSTALEQQSMISGVPIMTKRHIEIFGLPEKENNVYLLVTSPVAIAADELGRGAEDLLVPSGKIIEDGKIKKFSYLEKLRRGGR